MSQEWTEADAIALIQGALARAHGGRPEPWAGAAAELYQAIVDVQRRMKVGSAH